MSYLKYGFIFTAAALFLAPSTAEAQSFTQRGTRTGAICLLYTSDAADE